MGLCSVLGFALFCAHPGAGRCEAPSLKPGELGIDPGSGLVPTWRAPLGSGTGSLGLDLDDGSGLVVARLQGGRSVSIDLETGAVRAILVEAPQGSRPPPGIDPYSTRSFVMNGALVGPSGSQLTAIELRGGAVRYTRKLFDPTDDPAGGYALRDGLQGLAIGGLDVFLYPVRSRASARIEEILLALDPRTGVERWRRTVRLHATQGTLGAHDSARLGSDGKRVLVRVPGRLSALAADSGAELWSIPIPNPQGLYGAPQVTTVQIYGGGERVLVSVPGGALKLHDGRDGKLLADLTRSGATLLDAIVRREAVYLAVEEAPGTAYVEALDGAGKPRWKRPAVSSIARLRALAGGDALSELYVLEGNDRLWALDPRTGSERAGITVGYPYDFVVGRSRAGVPRAVVPLTALTAFDLVPGARPKPLAPYLRWQLERDADPKQAGLCHLRAAEWLDGEDKSLWQRLLPPRMRAETWGSCTEGELLYYQRRPRHEAHGLYRLLGPLDLGEALAVADPSGVLVLRKSDGQPLLDHAAPAGDDPLFFDDGRFMLGGLDSCGGGARGARVFARCGQMLVYFNGSRAVLIDARRLRVTAEGRYKHRLPAPGNRRAGESETVIPLGPYRLMLRGVIHMR